MVPLATLPAFSGTESPMTMTNAGASSPPDVIGTELTCTARRTGLLHLVSLPHRDLWLHRGPRPAPRGRRPPEQVVQPHPECVAGAGRHRRGAGHRAGPGADRAVVLPPVPQRRGVRSDVADDAVAVGLDPGLGRCGLPGQRPRQLPVPNRRQQPADPSRRLPARSGSRDS